MLLKNFPESRCLGHCNICCKLLLLTSRIVKWGSHISWLFCTSTLTWSGIYGELLIRQAMSQFDRYDFQLKVFPISWTVTSVWLIAYIFLKLTFSCRMGLLMAPRSLRASLILYWPSIHKWHLLGETLWFRFLASHNSFGFIRKTLLNKAVNWKQIIRIAVNPKLSERNSNFSISFLIME